MPLQGLTATYADFFTNVSERLGVLPVHSEEGLADLVDHCLPPSSIRALTRIGLTDAEAFRLVVPRRTLSHRIAGGQALSRDESDKAVRVARIAILAEGAFGDGDKAWRWLRKAKIRFAGKAPIDMIATEAGARLVEEALQQMVYGMAA